jgi:hypothetical protein
MTWPVDAFYRPTVALFLGGGLISVSPTYRQSLGTGAKKPSWVCAFDVELPDKVSNVTNRLLLCLETGAVLFDERLSEGRGLTCGVDELIGEALVARSPWDASGFTAFLRLPVFDQLDLLYRDYLGRGIDQEGLHDKLRELETGRSTILGVRDELLDCEEFRSRSISHYDQVGKWIVWGGLNYAHAPLILTGSKATSLTSLEISRRVSIPETLASISLGQEADPSARRLWIEDHKQLVSQLVETLRVKPCDTAAEPSRGNFRLNGLLGMMHPGNAGIREALGADKGHIASLSGKEGVVAFGPYLALPPGDYRAVLVFRSEINGESCVKFGIEVVYGAVLLARRDFREAQSRTFDFHVPFSVPHDDMAPLCDALFEFRLTCEGNGRLVLMDASVEHVTSAEKGSRYHVDWLPMMAVGSCTLRHDDWAVSAGNRASGHLVYGPYRALLPGSYTLTCECEVTGADSTMNKIAIEICAATGPVIVSRDFNLRNGPNTVETVFEINPFEPEESPRPLEFRISKNAPFEVRVTRLLTKPVLY